jgi:hypothetical protein
MSVEMPATKPELPHSAPHTEQLKDADWVSKMREHFAQSGFFRPEDVARVLGDPLQHADVFV